MCASQLNPKAIAYDSEYNIYLLIMTINVFGLAGRAELFRMIIEIVFLMIFRSNLLLKPSTTQKNPHFSIYPTISTDLNKMYTKL